ncbi:hypothetical protein SAMN02745857_00975 [Andreprevotia lacus DSM 23236]|jgi:hypothetical protein|uniref:Uncharacterized protein n=1 Tax=Andreprevotia lacus DSM 23236 TaxID=1121001 RepID=A0A1W1X976_9NEIS|nr:hypothetical protein [Andreprevotia lacus]SMC20466.1 hypothetical protein SAMN02745857_00975 [Andreprevotia lacus DSM 23236]
MHKLIFWIIPFALAGCQVAVKTPEGTKTVSALPTQQRDAAPQPVKTTAAAALPSGIYSYQAQTQHKDGRGKLQSEVARYSYTVLDLGGGRAQIRFAGEASAADPGGAGGLMTGETQVSGVAVFSNGAWQLSGKSEDGDCDGRFVVEGTAIKHLSGRCRDAGVVGDMGWPAPNTVLRFSRALRDGERAELQRGGATTKTADSIPAKGGNDAYAALIGKVFPVMALPYQVFGFDAYNARLEPFASNEMPEGKITVYPVRKGSARYVVIAAIAGNGTHRVVDVRQAAPGARNLRFVATTPDGGDLITTCTVNGKPVSQVFGFAQPGKKRTYTAVVPAQGESIWLVQPGGTGIVAFRAGDKLACKDQVFGG